MMCINEKWKSIHLFDKGDSITQVLENVFAFDQYDPQLRNTLYEIFQKHGIPLGMSEQWDTSQQATADSRAAYTFLPGLKLYSTIELTSTAADTLRTQATLHEGSLYADVKWRGISPEDADASTEHIQRVQLEGKSGAEWKPFEMFSARSQRFSEEQEWWRIGMVTREGITIKGVDPLQGSWLGDFQALASVQGCVCVLTSQMELLVYDVQRRVYRELNLAVGEYYNSRSVYAQGSAMIRSVSRDSLVIVDVRNSLVIRIQPLFGRLKIHQLHLQLCDSLDEAKFVHCSGMLPSLDIMVLFKRHQSEVYLVQCDGEGGSASHVRIHPAVTLVDVRIVASDALLLYCEDGAIHAMKLISNGDIGSARNLIHGMRFEMYRVDVVIRRRNTPEHFYALATRPAPESPIHLIGNEDTYAMFSEQLDSSPSTLKLRYWGYGRSQSRPEMLGELAGGSVSPETHEECQSCVHRKTGSLVNVTTCPTSSPLNVDHGIAVVEVVDIAQGKCRTIALSKTPGYGLAGKDNQGKGTGGSLADRGLKVTVQQKVDKRELGMSTCVRCCEMDDGRLCLLFKDAHVRILELREDVLTRDQVAWNGLTGQHRNLIESTEARRGYDAGEMDDEDYYDDESDGGDEDGEDDSEGNGRGRGRGRGNGRGTGRGKGGKGKGRDGRGGDGDGTSETARLLAESKEDAVEVLREARKRAKQASQSQRKTLDIDDVDEERYDEIYNSVRNEISQLHVILQTVEAKEKERVWLRGKASGEMDDSRLVDLAIGKDQLMMLDSLREEFVTYKRLTLIGEKNVYKQRGQRDEARLTQRLPKRLSFVVDISGSMAYFNGDVSSTRDN